MVVERLAPLMRAFVERATPAAVTAR